MIVDLRNLRAWLQQTLDGPISSQELTGFVQFSRSIIQAYLGYIRSSITQLCFHQGLTTTDLAYDSVAEAFARDEKGKFPHLENFVESLTVDLDNIPERELFLAFKSFLTRVADAQLARLFAQSDPAGAKIYRNIRDCVKQSGLFRIERDFRGLVLRPTQGEANDHFQEFPLDELEREFFGRVNHDATTGEFLRVLRAILSEQPQYRRSIPLVDVARIFKRLHKSDLEALSDTQPICVSELTEFEVDRIRLQVETALKEKIILTYLARGKIDRRQAEAMFNAFQDMMEDWCEGEESQSSLLGYLRHYLPMDDQQYEDTLRTKMEYLLKIVRDDFAARLMREI